MSADLDLDPKEVLMHLAEMGYCNITPKMLDDFINDLQRLILHESKKKKKKAAAILAQQSEDNSSTLPNTTDESSQLSPPPVPPPPPPTLQRKHRHQQGETQWKDTEEVSSTSSESSLAPAKRVLRECTKRISLKNQEKENILKDKSSDPSKVTPGPSKSCDCFWRRIGCKCYEENREVLAQKTRPTKENLAPPRPKSSFIRSWQLTGQPRPGSAPQRSDPVALYHQYQQLWRQQKLPGEARHNDLRWTIREKMLGQEPQPRPLSQASSMCSVSRRLKRM
uniref:Centriolar and ciliogenesis-associated protein HYLS1 C-terminal domain-containing protein n=1 Tax=Graphocephala atropunctata TaxID=36148 RepID=A0A1B6M1Q9_9HEMI